MQNNQAPISPTPNWRELRAEERAQRRAGRGSGGWIVGAVFILLGVVLMLENLGLPTLDNWWALFILLPAIGALSAAWQAFENNGGALSAAVVGPTIVGLILLGVTAAFLFELSINWGLIGPVLLILVGLSILLGGVVWRH